VLLAGCGGGSGPHLARADVAPLIALSHRIAREGSCAQARDISKLHDLAVSLVNERRVPSDLAEPFLSGATALSAQTPTCLPAVAIAQPPPAPGPSAAPPAEHAPRPHPRPRHEHRPHHGHRGHGKGD
jgi:hypothetical protein